MSEGREVPAAAARRPGAPL